MLLTEHTLFDSVNTVIIYKQSPAAHHTESVHYKMHLGTKPRTTNCGAMIFQQNPAPNISIPNIEKYGINLSIYLYLNLPCYTSSNIKTRCPRLLQNIHVPNRVRKLRPKIQVPYITW